MGLSYSKVSSLNRFDMIPHCDGRTELQTDRPNLSQLIQRSAQQAMLTRCKNDSRQAAVDGLFRAHSDDHRVFIDHRLQSTWAKQLQPLNLLIA